MIEEIKISWKRKHEKNKKLKVSLMYSRKKLEIIESQKNKKLKNTENHKKKVGTV